MKPAVRKPSAGFAGLKENWKNDLLSGFLVSLIALPLSLGIAEASHFPPMMGVLTAIVGGILVTFFTNTEMTVKGPAIGLVVIIAGAVTDLGKGDDAVGWHLALGVIVVAGMIQVLIGLLKLPRFADFFPLSAVHGMLAAIGIMIMAKQVHLALGISPHDLEGKSPFGLLWMIPHSLVNMEYHIAIIGLVSLMIMFGWRFLSFSFFKKIPPALVVVIVAIGLGRFFHISDTSYHDIKPFLDPGEFEFGYQASFAGVHGKLLLVFIKYVAMLVIVASLESLLTVKAIDLMDPFRRKADLSSDVAATGAGNIVAGLFGGLPMISEVARSSANINNGAKTRWANLFHGLFLLIFVLVLSPVVKMVPVAALAAMLIFVGFRLASPSEFQDIYYIGKEQLIIFLITIVVTLGTDLLVGIVSGTVAKIIIQLAYGVKLRHIFSPGIEVWTEHDISFVRLPRAAVFTNYNALKNKLDALPKGKMIQIDFSDSPYVDHTVMENITRFKNDYEQAGGHMELVGFEHHSVLSDHPLAARKIQRQLY